MPRPSIQRFRARVAVPRAGDGPLVTACRELSRRPDPVSGLRVNEWAPGGGAIAAEGAPRLTAGRGVWPSMPARG
jgi:hypothetical protein